MKAYKNNRAKSLSIRFDHELRELLLNDLMQFSFKKSSPIANSQAVRTTSLSVA